MPFLRISIVLKQYSCISLFRIKQAAEDNNFPYRLFIAARSSAKKVEYRKDRVYFQFYTLARAITLRQVSAIIMMKYESEECDIKDH